METASIKIARGNASRLKRLMHMRYKPSELAEEVGISTDTLFRHYLPAGAPCEVDQQGHTWIIGDHFAKWVLDYAKVNRRRQPVQKMEPGQAYCVTCRKVVMLLKTKVEKPNARGVANLVGKCPECGKRVIRFCKASEWQG